MNRPLERPNEEFIRRIVREELRNLLNSAEENSKVSINGETLSLGAALAHLIQSVAVDEVLDSLNNTED